MSEANKINTMANQTTAPDTVPHLELRDVFEQVRPEMARLEANDLLPIAVDPVTAAGIARGALMRLNPLREQWLPYLISTSGISITWDSTRAP